MLCRYPSSLHTFEFIPVPAQACLQHLGSTFPQLKLTQVTPAPLGPHPTPRKLPIRDRGPMGPSALLSAHLRWLCGSRASLTSALCPEA